MSRLHFPPLAGDPFKQEGRRKKEEVIKHKGTKAQRKREEGRRKKEEVIKHKGTKAQRHKGRMKLPHSPLPIPILHYPLPITHYPIPITYYLYENRRETATRK
jgi:hypothetical protein